MGVVCRRSNLTSANTSRCTQSYTCSLGSWSRTSCLRVCLSILQPQSAEQGAYPHLGRLCVWNRPLLQRPPTRQLPHVEQPTSTEFIKQEHSAACIHLISGRRSHPHRYPSLFSLALLPSCFPHFRLEEDLLLTVCTCISSGSFYKFANVET